MLDTAAVFALLAPSDEHHAEARRFVDEHRGLHYHTTTAIVAEAYTVLRRRQGYRVAMDWADGFRASSVVTIEFADPKQEQHAWDVLRRMAGVPLSYADASLVALSETLHMETIFTFDDDFRHAGLTVVPAR